MRHWHAADSSLGNTFNPAADAVSTARDCIKLHTVGWVQVPVKHGSHINGLVRLGGLDSVTAHQACGVHT